MGIAGISARAINLIKFVQRGPFLVNGPVAVVAQEGVTSNPDGELLNKEFVKPTLTKDRA